MSSSQTTPDSAQPPVGIDLGTTYSVLAYLDEAGRPTTVSNSLGDLLTPSAIFVDEDDILVGREAVRSSAAAPDSYAECFKRDMGAVSYRRRLRNLQIPPEVLSAFVLDRVKRDAEHRLGPIRKAVITVPAFFDETRRKATQDAGVLAGLEVLDIINEPTAAALAYGYQHGFLKLSSAGSQPSRQRVLVYDLGGGTFDVTILEIQGSRFRALATDGDVWLGGKDFDERLINHIAEQFMAANGLDPRSDPQDAAQLWLDAQEAKHALSERSKTMVTCFHAGIRMRIEISRKLFEDLTRDLVERTEITTSLVVKESQLNWSKIDRVLLVGGSSRIPMVAEMLRRVTGKEPDCSQSPDEAVAQGAALYAGMLMGQKSRSRQSSYELINVNSHSLGVVGTHPQTKQRSNVILIPKNTALPCEAVKTFRTAKADQRDVKVPVVEGESHRPEDCIALGQCVIRDLPAGLPQGTTVEVEYRYATNGRLSVHARVPCVRHSAHVEIRRCKTRDMGDLQSWQNRLLGRGEVSPEKSDGSGNAGGSSCDRATALTRLDQMYKQFGVVAAGLDLPASLMQSRRLALEANASLRQLQRKYKQAEQARHPGHAGPEAVQSEAALSQLRTELHRLEAQADFANLVLGRECAAAGICPAGAEQQLEEIHRLQRQLEGR